MIKKAVTEHIDGRELLKNPLEAEYRAFNKMLPRLLKLYKDEYVAIYKGKLLGRHPDDRELARKTYEQVGHVPFLLTKVSRHRSIAEIASPEEFSSASIFANAGGNKMNKNLTTKSRHLRGIPEDPSEAEFRAFKKMLPKLLKHYEGEHVAIYKGKLVGHHVDFSELGRKTFKKLGDVPFILPKVSRNWPEIMEFASSELILSKNGEKKMVKNVMTKPRHLQGIPEDPSEPEFRAFRKMLPRLLKRYEGEHVAIYKGKLVGHHADVRELARKTFKKLGYVPFILPKVSQYLPTYDFPSPEEF